MQKGLQSLHIVVHTVELEIKNCQNKNQLGFKSQIVDDRLHIYVLNHRQNKNKLDFKNQKIGWPKLFLIPSLTVFINVAVV